MLSLSCLISVGCSCSVWENVVSCVKIDVVQSGLDELKELIPAVAESQNSGAKESKAAVLAKGSRLFSNSALWSAKFKS